MQDFVTPGSVIICRPLGAPLRVFAYFAVKKAHAKDGKTMEK